jgi:hypothetical protein
MTEASSTLMVGGEDVAAEVTERIGSSWGGSVSETAAPRADAGELRYLGGK